MSAFGYLDGPKFPNISRAASPTRINTAYKFRTSTAGVPHVHPSKSAGSPFRGSWSRGLTPQDRRTVKSTLPWLETTSLHAKTSKSTPPAGPSLRLRGRPATGSARAGEVARKYVLMDQLSKPMGSLAPHRTKAVDDVFDRLLPLLSESTDFTTNSSAEVALAEIMKRCECVAVDSQIQPQPEGHDPRFDNTIDDLYSRRHDADSTIDTETQSQLLTMHNYIASSAKQMAHQCENDVDDHIKTIEGVRGTFALQAKMHFLEVEGEESRSMGLNSISRVEVEMGRVTQACEHLNRCADELSVDLIERGEELRLEAERKRLKEAKLSWEPPNPLPATRVFSLPPKTQALRQKESRLHVPTGLHSRYSALCPY